MSGTVLCVGALSLDTIFRLDGLPDGPGKFLPKDALQVVQGMATAQAASIVRLGGTARLWASRGDDAIGDRMQADLAAAGIDISALRRVAGARSGYSTILMDKRGERMIVPFYDPAIRTAPDALPDMSGIAAVSVDVRWPAAAEMALKAARARNLPVILDLEIAPPEVAERLLPLATHIIASEAGARAVTGQSAEESVALLGKDGATVAVTCGEAGLYWTDGYLPAFPIESVDTLAAGDVFHGAFALALVEGQPVARALRFAAAAAAIKCSRFGGRLGAPTRAEVEALLG